MALLKVVATAPDGSTVTDTRNMNFSIDQPRGTPGTGDRVISPAAVQELEKGNTVVVEWQLVEKELPSLYYSIDFGQSWQPVSEDIQNQGRYHLILPNDRSSKHVTLRVQGSKQQRYSDLFIIGEKEPRAIERQKRKTTHGPRRS